MNTAATIVDRLLEANYSPKEFISKIKSRKQYRKIAFAMGDDANEPLGLLDTHGVETVVRYLADWDYGEGEVHDRSQAGENDRTVYVTLNGVDYKLSYSLGMGYIGLEAIETIYE